MQFNRAELIEEFEENIRRYGGAYGEWCVGTAKDARGPFFQRHLVADLDDGMAYREAFTTDSAQAVAEHLVNHLGLQRDPEGSGQSAVGTQELQAAPEPGKLVFVYRKTRDTGHGIRDTRRETRGSGLGVGDSGQEAVAPSPPTGNHAAFPRRAA